jgi:hypothetical protein
MASSRPALTEAPQRKQPHWSRPVNSGPRPCLFDVGFPLQGSRTGLPPPISTSVPGTPVRNAIDNDDLIAALRAHSEILSLSAMQLSRDAKASLSEVFITAEGLDRGAGDVLATLLHEAAHAIAHKRGIKDTSRQGRYHNQRFKEIAEELGLEVCRDRQIGWSLTSLSDTTANAYNATVAELAVALSMRPRNPCSIAPHRKVSRNGATLVCECGRRTRSARTVLAPAAICGVCSSGVLERS